MFMFTINIIKFLYKASLFNWGPGLVVLLFPTDLHLRITCERAEYKPTYFNFEHALL